MVGAGVRRGWDEPLLDFLIWTSKIPGWEDSDAEGSFAAIRFTRIVDANVDFSTQAHRAKATIKCLKKREGVARKQPFNTDLLRWMRKELVCKSSSRSNGDGSMYFELYASRILVFLSTPDLRNRSHKMGDISVEVQDGEIYLSIRIRRPKTDISKDGIIRTLIEIDSSLFPVGGLFGNGNEWLPTRATNNPSRMGHDYAIACLP